MSYICLECISDKALLDIVAVGATQIQCQYCDQQGLGISMYDLAKIVDEPLRKYIKIGECFFPGDKQEGDSLEYLIQEELGIDYPPAVDLIQILKEIDPSDPRDGGEYFFCDDEKYLRSSGTSGEYPYNWEDFTNRIKHQQRFFDEYGRTQLAVIFGEPKSSKAVELPMIEVGPGTGVELVFRARLVDSEQKAKEILKNPIAELGPPLPKNAIAGRMNPTGISVFYGAFSQGTAIAEVRPFVGSLVVVGSFKPLRKLRLLNLPQINAGFTGSIFYPDYEDRLARVRFFEMFHTLIARPIQPHEQPLEYIPTQAVAEYIANVIGFDGILYASAQVGLDFDVPEPSSGIRIRELNETELSPYNLVLFNNAATVKQAIRSEGVENSSELTTALIYQADSAKLVKITGVQYNHEMTFIDIEI